MALAARRGRVLFRPGRPDDRVDEGDLAEIGVWQGESAILLSHFVNEGETLYALDVFDLYYPGEVPLSPAKPYANPAIFTENLSAHGCVQAVTPIASDNRPDPDPVAKLAGRGVRFFHIDGGHSYDHVVSDCSTALAVVADSSVVVLDDFMQIDNPPVTEAIVDTFRGAPKQPGAVRDNSEEALPGFSRRRPGVLAVPARTATGCRDAQAPDTRRLVADPQSLPIRPVTRLPSAFADLDSSRRGSPGGRTRRARSSPGWRSGSIRARPSA